jgi:uncharacterized damage-inducible protein DinB
MIAAQCCQTMAAYGAWMNGKLFERASHLQDSQRKADRGAFFGSLHSTLNHILWADRIWLPRFNGKTYASGPIGVDLYDDFDALRAARTQMDAEIAAWALAVRDEELTGTLTWYSRVAERELSRPRALCVMQMFNHATHHRGQATTLLKQCGIDPGITDLPWAPLARDAQGRIVLADEYGL